MIRSQTGDCLTEPGADPALFQLSLGRSVSYQGRVTPTCFREERMDKPRIFLGSSGKQGGRIARIEGFWWQFSLTERGRGNLPP